MSRRETAVKLAALAVIFGAVILFCSSSPFAVLYGPVLVAVAIVFAAVVVLVP